MSSYILLELKTPNDLIQVARFLADRSICSEVITQEKGLSQYDFTQSGESIQTLVDSTLQSTLISKQLLERTVFAPWVSSSQIVQSNTSLLQIPSKAFQSFCGSEWLSSTGTISIQLAKERILVYAGVKNLLGDTSVLHLDETLQNLFQTKDTTIYYHELALRIRDNLFDSKE